MSAKTIEDVPCMLSAEEQLLKSKELTQLMRERAEVDVLKKSSASMYKDMAERLDERIRVLADAVSTGCEIRPVECYERPRYADGLVDIVRADNGDRYRVRAMHPDERQTAMADIVEQSIKPRGGRDDEGVH
jgi:hypothetical protein